MNDLYLIGTVLATVLLLAPSLSFLVGGWRERRFEILSGIYSDQQNAIKTYFKQFHPRYERDEQDQVRRFEKYYDTQYGRKRFILPIVLFLLVAAFLLFQCLLWVQSNDSAILNPPSKIVGVFAVFGAYMWVLNDQITRWWYADLSPGDLYWACFRFVVAVPLGYAISQFAAENIGPAVAFLLGAFPTDSLFSLMRKLGRQKLGLGEGSENVESELQSLHGVDARKAERFGEEGITTVSQLAYYDPIKLTIRTNLGYSYIVDCVSQALLWIYTERDQDKWRKVGLRSAFEIINLSDSLSGTDEGEKEKAEAIVKLLASQLNTDAVAVRNIVEEVAGDPYSEFIYYTWADNP